jgi:hypothetical protein
MWESQHLTTLWASRACYRDSFTYFLFRVYRTSGWASLALFSIQQLNSWDDVSNRVQAGQLRNRSLFPGRCKEKFHFSTASRPTSYILVTEGSFPRSKAVKHEVDHSPSFNAEVKNCGAVLPLLHVFMACCLRHRGRFWSVLLYIKLNLTFLNFLK